MREIYLDNSATTKPTPSVVGVVTNSLENLYYNPSSIYNKGIEVSKEIEKTRELIAKTMGASSRGIIFTSGGTESTNTSILSATKTNRGKHIVTTAYEHDATLKTIKILEQKGYKISYIKPKDGKIQIEDIINEINEDTALISVMEVNNETGHIIDVNKLGSQIKTKYPNIIFHIDAVQSYMKIPVDINKSKADFVSISAHKIHGIKGCGVLYAKNPNKLTPLIYGGGQEKSHRSGTENTLGIIGLGKAVEEGFANMQTNTAKQNELKNYLKEKLESEIENIKINSPQDGVCHILNVSFVGVKGEILLHTLESNGIYVSTGSACSSKKKGSHVLQSLGLKDNEIEGAIRFSFSHLNEKEEIDILMPILKEAVEEIRMLMKFGRR